MSDPSALPAPKRSAGLKDCPDVWIELRVGGRERKADEGPWTG